MLHFILITVCVLLNVICLWSIHIIIKDMDNLTWKSCLKYLSGIPIGAGLSLLLSPITVQNIILLALMGGIVGELLSLLVLTIKLGEFCFDGGANREDSRVFRKRVFFKSKEKLA